MAATAPRPPATARPGQVAATALISTPAKLQQTAAPANWRTAREWSRAAEDINDEVGATRGPAPSLPRPES